MLSLLRSLQLIQRLLGGLFTGIINPMLCGMGPDALVEFIHSPLFSSQCFYANSMQERTKWILSRCIDALQRFQARVMRLKIQVLFPVKVGSCSFQLGSAPSFPFMACSPLPPTCLFMTCSPFNPTLIYALIETRFWVLISPYYNSPVLATKSVEKHK